MVSLVSSSLKTNRLIFIWPLDSLWGCWPWNECLETPDLLDLDDTDEEVDAVLWSLWNPQSGKEGREAGLAITLMAPDPDPILTVVLSLLHDVLAWH